MRKNLLLFVALIGALLLASCSGGSKSKSVSSVSTVDVKNATEVIKYYNTSLNVLQKMVKEKEINTILGYMEQKGKAPTVLTIAPITISEKDTTALLNPGDCFNAETRLNLQQNYAGLFGSRTQFYANFDTYLSYMKAGKYTEADKLLNVNYQLSTEMSEYKQNIFDILSPFTEQAEQVLLADNPLKEQIMTIRKMTSTMQSIINLYARKPVFEGARIDHKLIELKKQLDAARKLPVVAGHDNEMKTFQDFLSQVDVFVNKVQKAREKGEYTDADYEMLTSAYETSII
ncbi:DUF6845 domain-containing protein [Bacteroides sp.]